MGYIGVQPEAGFTSGLLDRFTSQTGSTVTLTHDISSENDIIVFVNFVKQDSTNYSVGGSGNKTLTLGGTLVSSDIVEVHYLNIVKLTQQPSANSVGITELNVSDGTNGQVLKTNGSGTLSFGDDTGGKIGQVVANHITTQTASSSSTFADVGGSETTIVTTASSSKVLLHISLSARKTGNQYLALDLYRKIGSGSYSKIVDFENGFLYTNSTLIQTGRMAVSYLDQPSSADTIKYKFQFNAGLNGASVVINPDGQETSSIILQEVLA